MMSQNKISNVVAQTSESREYSFANSATIVLTAIGFVGLSTGLSNLLSGHTFFAVGLAFCFQGLAVAAIHHYKRARQNGSRFNLLRGWQWLTLYVLLVSVIVTMAFSFWYKLQRADEAANESFLGQKQEMLSKLTQLESRYKAIGDGFSDLAKASAARAAEEKNSGNTCKLPSPKGPGPIQQFRTRDNRDFRDYSFQLDAKVREITDRGKTLRARTLGHGGEIRTTEAALNELTTQVNAGLIGNPMLSGVMQFIDGRLLAADQIAYFGKVVKCEDEQRTAQLIALKHAVREIMAEKPLTPVKLLDPDNAYTNTMLAANRVAALVAATFTTAKLSELDPGVRDAKLANGLKVFLPADYWPLAIAGMIEAVLFFLVPAPRRDEAKRDFVQALAHGDVPFSLRTVRQLLWLAVSVPPSDADFEEPARAAPIDLPGKFVRLRPYLHTDKTRSYLVIPHAPESSLNHDYATALVLKGHAKPLANESFTVGTLPSPLWRERTLRLLTSRPSTVTSGSVVTPFGHAGPLHDMPVRVLEVSREFLGWMISRIVELDQEDLVPEAQPRKLA